MEKLKVKHDHTLTDIIKVAIFALFLILPILMFLPTGLYYGFNEHATAQEVIKEEPVYYETNEVISIDDLVVGNVYRWNDNYSPTYIPTGYQAIINIEKTDNLKLYVNTSLDFSDLRNFTLILVPNTGNLVCQYYDSNNTNRTFNLTNQSIDFVIKSFASYFNNTTYLISHISSSEALFIKEYQEVIYEQDISNSMNNAWQSLWTTPMLSWTDTNTFQFTINAFVTVFGITQESYLANYLTYILVVTCIYLVFDIVLTLTTKLTHLINEK